MSKISTQRLTLIITAGIVFAAVIMIIGYGKLNAQVPAPMGGGAGAPMTGGMPGIMPGMMPGMPGGAQSASPAVETKPLQPKVKFSSMVSNVRTLNIRNWDGTITPMLRFKYRINSNRPILNVSMPLTLTKEQRTKNSWETLFQNYSMNKESTVDAAIKRQRNKANEAPARQSFGMTSAMPTMPGGMGMTPPMSGGAGGGVTMPPVMPTLPSMPAR